MKSTIARLLEAVFEANKFKSIHKKLDSNEIIKCINLLPYSLSKSQKDSIIKCLSNDISYIQGPPGTGKSFTISALTIVAKELGLKVLVASQKPPAVNIVHQKISEVLGESSSLYISESTSKKEKLRFLIENLIFESSNTNLISREKHSKLLSEEINTLIKEKIYYSEKVKNFEEKLNSLYLKNLTLEKQKNILIEDWRMQKLNIKKINPIKNKDEINLIKLIIKNCLKIKENSIYNNIKKKDEVKLKFLSKAVTKKLNIQYSIYSKGGEELLYQVLEFSITLAEVKHCLEEIKKLPIENSRKVLNRRNLQLYSKKQRHNTSKNLLEKNFCRQIKLLKKKNYKENLELFKKRIRWKNSQKAKKANSGINFNLLFELFPIIIGEIKSLHPYLPFKEEIFDLLILDEASQVNLAEIFPILFRAKRFCIVGDHKQLGIQSGGVIFVNKFFEKLTWQKYFYQNKNLISDYKSAEEKDLLVSKSSILNLIRNDQNPVSAAPIQLNEHFRSLPMLAEFTNEEFYKDDKKGTGLKIMTALPDKKAINAFMDIEVKTERENNSKINKGEIEKALEIIENIINKKKNKYTNEIFNIPELKNDPLTIGIVSFIRDQVSFIKDMSERMFTDKEMQSVSLMIGTPEEFQGNERDIMFFTPSIDINQKRSKAFMEDPNRFNVATSRAKFFTYFIHGKIPPNMKIMEKFITKMKEGKKYLKDKDKNFLPIGWVLDLKKCDSDFERSVLNIISETIKEISASRLHVFNKVKSCGYEIDIVIFDSKSNKALGIDLDGKHLEINKNDLDDHFERANSLRRAGWSIQYFPYWLFLKEGWIEKDFECINELKVFFIKFFNIMPKIIFDESQDKQEENYPEKDNNFISIEIKNGFERI
tara:strand:- start:1247 stop:3880 length:2634 start_codon:yes stop_codon:yes gene_type:complete